MTTTTMSTLSTTVIFLSQLLLRICFKSVISVISRCLVGGLTFQTEIQIHIFIFLQSCHVYSWLGYDWSPTEIYIERRTSFDTLKTNFTSPLGKLSRKFINTPQGRVTVLKKHRHFTIHQMPPKPSPESSLSYHYSAPPRASLLRSSSSAPGSLPSLFVSLLLRQAPCPWRGREPWCWGWWGCRRREHSSHLPQGFQK